MKTLYDVQTAVRLPRALHVELVARAEREHYRLSDEIRRTLWRGLEAQNDDDPSPHSSGRVTTSSVAGRRVEP